MSWPAEYEHVFRLLDRVRPTPTGWRCCCPAHDDRHPSATVRRGNQGLLIRCHGPKCSFGAILSALATRAGSPLCLKPFNGDDGTRTRRPPRRIRPMKPVKTYVYTDEAGEVLYEKLRYEPGRDGRKKDFMVRRPNPDYDTANRIGEQWLWTLDGCRRVLYGLPDLIEALRGQYALPQNRRRLVWLLEGEKDAETAGALGLLATTGDGGARNLHLTETDVLAGSNVVVPFDRDEPDARTWTVPGIEHALQAVNMLTAQDCRVRLLRLPGRGDFTDWAEGLRAAGRGDDAIRAELRRLVRAAPVWGPWGPDGLGDPRPAEMARLMETELAGLRADGSTVRNERELFGELAVQVEAVKGLFGDAYRRGHKADKADAARRLARVGAWLLAAAADLNLFGDDDDGEISRQPDGEGRPAADRRVDPAAVH